VSYINGRNGSRLRKEFNSILRAAFFIMIVLIAFSRKYLGVHTPQDVVIGVLAGMLVMWGTLKLMTWLEAHPEKKTAK
jgi:membrane-associated phospholipid phosphatase